MYHAVHQRIKTAVIGGFAGCKGNGPHRATVKSTCKTDEIHAFGMVARQFDGCLHRFGA